MSLIESDDPAKPTCLDGQAHVWHVICEACGGYGYHNERSEEIAAWERLKAERDQLMRENVRLEIKSEECCHS